MKKNSTFSAPLTMAPTVESDNFSAVNLIARKRQEMGSSSAK
jgi:hypothetical protein